MGLHQQPVPGLPERLELDRLLGPARRLSSGAGAQARVGQGGHRAAADVGEFAPLVLNPLAVVARQEGPPGQRLRQQGRGLRRRGVARGEGPLRLVGRVGRGDRVDPGPLGQLEPVAAEGRRQRTGAVESRLGEQRTQLAHQHRQCLIPGRWRSLLPQGRSELVPRHRPSPLHRQVGEQQPALPPRQARVRHREAVGLERDPPHQENLQAGPPSRLLAYILPRSSSAFLGSPYPGPAGGPQRREGR